MFKWIKSLFDEMPESEIRRLKKLDEYFDQNVFFGLTNLNDGFDLDPMKYFSRKEFEIVLRRVQALGFGVYEINTWKNGSFCWSSSYISYAVDTPDSGWFWECIEELQNQYGTLLYGATYHVPEKFMEEPKT